MRIDTIINNNIATTGVFVSIDKESLENYDVSANEEDEIRPEEEEEETETKTKKASTKVHVQRYKGLGEMNAEELWETTMDPSKRVLKQVKVSDIENSNKIFEMLMGSEVPPRKTFITSNAKMANLDI